MKLGIALRQAPSWAPWRHRDGLPQLLPGRSRLGKQLTLILVPWIHKVHHLSQERPRYIGSLKKERHLMGN